MLFSFLLRLVGDTVDLSSDDILVSEIPLGEDLHVIVELIDQWDSGGDVDTYDLLIGDVLDVLHQLNEGVSV